MRELRNADNYELDHCKKALKGNNYYKHEHCEAIITKFVELKDKLLRENVTMKVNNVYCVPLTLGKVQIGKVTNAQRELLLEELCLYRVLVDEKKKITILKQILMKNEHSENNNDWKIAKFFKPTLFNAND